MAGTSRGAGCYCQGCDTGGIPTSKGAFLSVFGHSTLLHCSQFAIRTGSVGVLLLNHIWIKAGILLAIVLPFLYLGIIRTVIGNQFWNKVILFRVNKRFFMFDRSALYAEILV